MIHTLGSEFVHFYALEENGEVTLVDAGVQGYRDTLEQELARFGRSLGDVKAVVLTHGDADHVGFAGQLQAQHGIPVYIHRADSDRVRAGKIKKTEGSPLAILPILLHAQGRRLIGHMATRGGAKLAKLPDVIAFDDGDELDVPGRLRAIHTPGHTDGHTVLHAPGEDALFVGDALNNVNLITGEPGARIPPRPMNTSNSQVRASLGKIEQIDATHLYFGHGEPSSAGAAAVVAEARANG